MTTINVPIVLIKVLHQIILALPRNYGTKIILFLLEVLLRLAVQISGCHSQMSVVGAFWAAD